MQPNTQMFGRLAAALETNWRMRARPSQLPPAGDDWNGWLVKSGRGFGKTWVGSNWTNELAETGKANRIALIGATASDVRDTMIEGESGIIATAPERNRPHYEPSKRRLTWPSGGVATAFSSEEADRLRGPQHDFLWADEFAAWNDPQSTWDMAMFGLRLGQHPRWLVTTTPKPLKLLKELIARDDVRVTTGTTFENAANLAPTFLEAIRKRYEGTRLGRQELNAELLEDVQGALWTRAMIDAARMTGPIPAMQRVVVAVDPSGTAGATDQGDAVGIVVAGRGTDGLGYILADCTCKLSPDGWGKAAVKAYHTFKADRIVAERNFGGAMVEHVIRTVDKSVSYKEVTASRGKVARAEPVSALYEQNRVKHIGSFPELEDEMCAMSSDGYVGDGSPDRADAAIWALTELLLGDRTPPRLMIQNHGIADDAKATPPETASDAALYAPRPRPAEFVDLRDRVSGVVQRFHKTDARDILARANTHYELAEGTAA